MVVIHDDKTRPFEMDDLTGAMLHVDSSHHEVHEGEHYFVESYMTLGNGEVLRLRLITPDTTKWAHFVWEIQSSNILTAEFYEDPTGGMGGGTNLVAINNNRNSSNTSALILTGGIDAATDNGTLLASSSWGSKSGGGGGHTREDEIILKQNTTYMRIFTSGAASNIVTFKAMWYEHTPKY